MLMTTLETLKPLQQPLLQNSIAIRDLSFQDRSLVILEAVNLTLSKGEFVVLFGPNGGGKTTLLKLLMGFLKPARGTLSLFGKSPVQMRKMMGYVPQKGPFDPLFPLTTLDVVLQGALSRTTRWGRLPPLWKEKGRALLHQMGLSHLEKRPFGRLSGGQAQRALIARALLGEPSLLLLDEPTAHVDPGAEKEILDLLIRLKRECTILLVSHQLTSLLSHADQLLLVNRTATPFQPHEICQHFELGLYPNKKTYAHR